MALFFVITAIYSGLILYMIIKRVRYAGGKLQDDIFLSKEHTDAIKGVAAAGILLSHIAGKIKYGVDGPVRYYVVLFATLGGIGVNLFFFASGFGNYWSTKKLNNPVSRVKWLLKRSLSLLCIFIICFLLAVLALRFAGYRQTFFESMTDVLRLRMPLTITWYLKVQLLLYFILFVLLFFKRESVRFVLLIGGSFAVSLFFFLLGFDEEWWKSTMCFPAGYCCAMYKDEVLLLLNKKHKLILCVSIAAMPMFFIMACLIDSYIVKVLGNTLLMLAMMVVLESVRFDDRYAAKLGIVSLEIYLSHIPLCSWFLRARIPDNAGIVFVLIGTVVTVALAKLIDGRMLPLIRRI